MIDAASGDVRRLDYVIRYSSIPVNFKESVSAHSYWVSLYSLLIHRKISTDTSLIGPILLKAVIHDVAEAKTGDLVRTFKYSLPELKEAVDKAEDLIVSSFHDQISSLFGLFTSMVGTDDLKYVEAVVKAADFLSLQQFMNREWLRGNREITPFFERMLTELDSASEKVFGSDDSRIRSLWSLYNRMKYTAVHPNKLTAV